jgi:hypothetical protein
VCCVGRACAVGACVQKGQLGYVEGAVESVPWVVEDVAGLGVISAISAAAGFLSSHFSCVRCGAVRRGAN